ncbi:MAG: beta-ketoacyl-ACP synthase II [Planctomycetia bacterium]|jgi:3-oxoacyl-[acyl-carrier-protein] synthase II|nr:beta-ketoacyl-ACP synthase II [Planctomycetia bacterium]
MKTITLRRVVVTGLGAVTDLGTDVASTWEGMMSGRSGIGPITAFEQDDEWTTRFAGEVSDFDPSKIIDVREAKRMDRASLLGLVAAEEAATDSGIDFETGDPDRRGVAIGSGIGGIITIEVGLLKLERTSPKKISPFTVPKLMVNACAGNVSIRHGLRGANIATATACATGGHSIGAAFQLIQRGDADVMFAGGTEAAVSRLCIGSFGTMKALSTRNDDPERASRPFDRDRDGFVLAEGAAVLILEDLESAKARGAKIYGEILGYATSGDAHHIAAPEESGIGATKAMTWALKDAGINTTDVGYINAHGTSTPLGDAAEVYAVKSVFGEHANNLAMSSTKSMTGHALGAAGGIESVAVIRALQDGVLPPTINLESPDDGFDLDFVANEAREKPIQYAVNNSFGFGGHNVSLVFSRYNGD